MTTIGSRTNQKSTTHVTTNNTISATTLSSWSRQQKLAMIAGLAILGLLLAASACTKESPKPALVGVSGPPSSPASSPTMRTTALDPATASAMIAAASPAPTKKAAKKRPAKVVYRDADSGISFLYPRKAVLSSGNTAELHLATVVDVPLNFVQPGGVTAATVALPANMYPGTDFASAFFTVNVHRNVSEEGCAHFAFVDSRNVDGEPVDAEKVKVGQTEMAMTSNFSASVVKQVETQYYHNFENGACYEYVLGLGTEGFATVGGIRHVNRDQVFAKLHEILASVKIDAKKIDAKKIDAKKINPVEQKHLTEPAISSIGGGKK